MKKYYIDAQNKAGQWRNKEYSSLKELIDCFLYWKALQFPVIHIQRRIHI